MPPLSGCARARRGPVPRRRCQSSRCTALPNTNCPSRTGFRAPCSSRHWRQRRRPGTARRGGSGTRFCTFSIFSEAIRRSRLFASARSITDLEPRIREEFLPLDAGGRGAPAAPAWLSEPAVQVCRNRRLRSLILRGARTSGHKYGDAGEKSHLRIMLRFPPIAHCCRDPVAWSGRRSFCRRPELSARRTEE